MSRLLHSSSAASDEAMKEHEVMLKRTLLVTCLSSLWTLTLTSCVLGPSPEVPSTVLPLALPTTSPTATTVTNLTPQPNFFWPPSPSIPTSTGEEAIPTDEWAVQLVPGTDPDEIAKQYDAENLGPIGTLPNAYLFRRPNYTPDDTTSDPLAEDPRVVWLEQQYARQRHPRNPP